MTMRSGFKKSSTANPSLRNSGFETTEKSFLETFFEIIFSMSSPVVTGTVDLVIIILNLLIDLLISFATLYTWLKSALFPFFLVGVPTQIKIISDFEIESFKFVENFKRLFL